MKNRTTARGGGGEKKERCLAQRQEQTQLKWPLPLDRIIKAVRSGCIPSRASFLLLEEVETGGGCEHSFDTVVLNLNTGCGFRNSNDRTLLSFILSWARNSPLTFTLHRPPVVKHPGFLPFKSSSGDTEVNDQCRSRNIMSKSGISDFLKKTLHTLTCKHI